MGRGMALDQGRQTRFLQDILRQPSEMRRAVEFLMGPGKSALCSARSLIESSRGVVLTGIGASWHAVMTASTFFDLAGHPVVIQDAGELLHFKSIPWGVVVAISRTGRSVEIVKLLAKAKANGAAVIGITNCAESPLARQSDISVVVPTPLDHGISVATFSTLRLAVCALAKSSETSLESVAQALTETLDAADQRLAAWSQQLDRSRWLEAGAPYYFLARGASLGSSYEARLLWEEGVKAPATAMSTSSFRHGPQEIVRPGMRFCIWIDQSLMRDQDLSVAHDLRKLGASVMVIGENVSSDDGDLVCELPSSPEYWQFAIDILPAQLAAERLSKLSGVDCDSFRLCSYVVEDEHGLLHKEAEVIPDAK
jgi:glutamine---fructose-6-phosphate transaminase (isomerizing)